MHRHTNADDVETHFLAYFRLF